MFLHPCSCIVATGQPRPNMKLVLLAAQRHAPLHARRHILNRLRHLVPTFYLKLYVELPARAAPLPWFSYNGRIMRFLIALLAIAGIFDSCLALRIHYQDPAAAPPCAVTEKFDCGTVNHSRYADFPPRTFDDAVNSKGIHIPVAILGIIGYAFIAILALTKQYWLTLQASEIGFALAAFLSYLEAYVLEKWCIYCLYSMCIISAIVLLTIVTLVMNHLRNRKASVILYP